MPYVVYCVYNSKLYIGGAVDEKISGEEFENPDLLQRIVFIITIRVSGDWCVFSINERYAQSPLICRKTIC